MPKTIMIPSGLLILVDLQHPADRYNRPFCELCRHLHFKLVLLEGLIQIFQGDRKSTRLNSSHVAISYAVFCLKKKKKQATRKREIEKKTKHENDMRSKTNTE